MKSILKILCFAFITVLLPAASATALDGSYTIDYNVVLKSVDFSYGEINAAFTLPSDGFTIQYRWKPGADATGKLVITCETPSVYLRRCAPCYCGKDCPCVHPFSAVCPEKGRVWHGAAKFKEAPLGGNVYELAINENSEVITFNPELYALLSRRALTGDNPAAKIYMANGSKSFTGIFSVDIAEPIKRPYERRVHYPPMLGESGVIPGTGGWSSYYDCGVGYGYFENKPTNEKSVSVKIYNGQKNLPVTPAFISETQKNQNRSPKKIIMWESTMMPIEVVRMMYSETADEKLINMRELDGQYKRSFTEQNKAELEWGVIQDRSMPDNYAPDREKSKLRSYKTNDAVKAVFASDVSYSRIMFPIKSGYFFNPAGTYTFTLTTEIYKRTDGETKEHQHLADELIRSFRYETNLVYINPDPRDPNYRKAVTIDNQPLDLTGTTYTGERAFITAEGSPLVQVKVETDYELDKKKTKKLLRAPVTQAVDTAYANQTLAAGVTDESFRRVLEGYNESGTANSRLNYKYTEYVKEGETIFKVVETTTVTITINPKNRKLFTHMMMKNGKYYARAYTADITLGRFDLGGEYQLNNLQDAAEKKRLYGYVLDKIDIAVVGSMADDTR